MSTFTLEIANVDRNKIYWTYSCSPKMNHFGLPISFPLENHRVKMSLWEHCDLVCKLLQTTQYIYNIQYTNIVANDDLFFFNSESLSKLLFSSESQLPTTQDKTRVNSLIWSIMETWKQIEMMQNCQRTCDQKSVLIFPGELFAWWRTI